MNKTIRKRWQDEWNQQAAWVLYKDDTEMKPGIPCPEVLFEEEAPVIADGNPQALYEED